MDESRNPSISPHDLGVRLATATSPLSGTFADYRRSCRMPSTNAVAAEIRRARIVEIKE